MDNEIRFLYSVYPKKPIKDLLSNGRPINSPKTLSLTKEEVLFCMKSGTVYRRYGEDNRNERVTTLNIDRLHNRKFISEEEWKKQNNAKDVVVETPKQETVKTEIKPEEESTNKVAEAEEVKEESKDEILDNSEEVDEEVSEEVATEETSNEETEEVETDDRGTVVNTTPESDDEQSESDNNTYYNYSHRKKKRH